MSGRIDRNAHADMRQRRALQRTNAGIDPLAIPTLEETPSDVQPGDLWVDRTLRRVHLWIGGEQLLVLGGEAALLRDSSYIAGTVAETVFGNTWTMGADSFTDKRCITVEASGDYSTTGTPSLTLKLKASNKTLFNLGAVTLGSGVSNKAWYAKWSFILHDVGASAQVMTSLDGVAIFDTALLSGIEQEVTINKITDRTIGISAQWSAASASNKVRMRRFRVMMF